MRPATHAQRTNAQFREYHLHTQDLHKRHNSHLLLLLQPGKVERHSQSFWREAEMLSNLNHPHVLRFYGVVVESYAEPNVIGIMTEYMKGGSLSAFLRSVYCICML